MLHIPNRIKTVVQTSFCSNQ